jgi:GNAT superfamily N-acetyltransferase
MAMTAMTVDVPDRLITSYLEMTTREQFVPAFLVPLGDIEIVWIENPDVEFYRFLYTSVGYHLRWRDRLIMTIDALQATLNAPETSVYVLYVNHVPAGYVELVRQGDNTEIAYFGLRSSFQGRGLGKHLLSFGIQRAWDDGALRVWVHTCNLDGQYALENYIKRGFQVYQVEEVPMPERYRD